MMSFALLSDINFQRNKAEKEDADAPCGKIHHKPGSLLLRKSLVITVWIMSDSFPLQIYSYLQ